MIKNYIKSVLIITFLSVAYSSTNFLYSQDTSTENKTINFKELEDQIDLLFKEIDKLNKDFNSKISKQLESLINENKNYLNQLESEYKSKIKESLGFLGASGSEESVLIFITSFLNFSLSQRLGQAF